MKHGKLIFALLVIICLSSCTADNKVREDTKVMEDNKVMENVYLNGRNVGGKTESEVRSLLEEHSNKLDLDTVDASFDNKTWQVTDEKLGRRLNIEKTLDRVMNAGKGDTIRLEFDTPAPQRTGRQLRQGINEIASYTTPLMDRRDSRINNIDLAAQQLDYYKLLPGDEFSFNKAVGKRTAVKGYEEAPIIVKTENGPKKKMGVGGGVCQLSTTLYNAVEECGLRVTERHLHSKPVGYVPKGEDATVARGVDFRFQNNRNYPVMIRVIVKNRSLTVKLYENRNPQI